MTRILEEQVASVDEKKGFGHELVRRKPVLGRSGPMAHLM